MLVLRGITGQCAARTPTPPPPTPRAPKSFDITLAHRARVPADALRREVLAHGVAVAIVEPGAVATPIFDTFRGASLAAAVAARSPAARTYPVRKCISPIARESKHRAPSGGGQLVTCLTCISFSIFFFCSFVCLFVC